VGWFRTRRHRGFLEAYATEGYEVHDFRLATCECGSHSFHLEADDNEGVAKRTCSKCTRHHFLCDSEEYWEDAEPQMWKCIECNSEDANIGVGFSLYEDDGEIRWLYVGYRCARCGVLGCFAGWKIAYAPSKQLMIKSRLWLTQHCT
jgi:hypothetical protein